MPACPRRWRAPHSQKVRVTIAHARVPHAVALQAKLINHTSGGTARRILKKYSLHFLIERLAGSPLLVTDADSLKDFAVRFGGQLQSHFESIISSAAKDVCRYSKFISAPRSGFLIRPRGRPVDLEPRARTSQSGSRKRPRNSVSSLSDRSRNTNQTLHATQIVF